VHGFWLAFGLVFLAELGDKTQLATLMLSANGHGPLPVFLGAALALVLVALISALVGDALGHALPVRLLRIAGGVAFVLMGGLLIISKH
jgi:putative Ca2+/H+ antiporter (TMEM165/GDT1 family)